MKHTRKSAFAVVAAVLALAQLTACGTAESSSTPTSAKDKLQAMTLDDIRSKDYLTYDKEKDGAVEKSAVSVPLKWLPQAQFMGYYVAKAKGYYDEVGLDVTIVSGGGDISETTAVYNGTVDFGVTWVSNLINANAGGMDLLEVAQVYQRSGLVLVYKKK